jgi:hypothetical protein
MPEGILGGLLKRLKAAPAQSGQQSLAQRS